MTDKGQRGKEMRELTNVEEKILDKTLYLIGRTGKLNVPIRAIAKEAKVNVSAINYYFRTKEEMLDLVKKFYLENTIEAYSALDNEALNTKERIVTCASDIIDYIIKYPGVMVILKEARQNKESNGIDAEIIQVSEEMEIKYNEKIREFFGNKNPIALNKQVIFLSSVLYPALNIEINNTFKSLIENKTSRLEYITSILDLLSMDKI